MTKTLSEKEDETESDTTPSENAYDKELLITEYTQAGEEFRYRDRLLHNSYYLLIIASVAIVGVIMREFRSGNLLTTGLSVMIGGLGLSLIGTIILNHFIQRRSAESLRTRTEQYAEGIHDEPVQRPLGIQYWVIGNNSIISGKQLQKSSTFWEELKKCPQEVYSAKTVSNVTFWGGLLLFVVGGVTVLTAIYG
ncbi:MULTISPECIES: hypothetical protein [Halorussus]|uniref:hypothetical protein n=1 Tax=Halorussus TaxID=1070314 RepID=UPI0013B46EEF|nr:MULTISPECIES: hypothetical protein [Halorussus]NHN58925.1 hypothetical protein [Halorussus sp. JP-T4]